RELLRDGYSAGVMRVIYDQDRRAAGLADRVFFDYPLHRAVYDRLKILTREIEPELERRLESGAQVRILTAPSGFGYDLFKPLESIATRRPELMRQVELVAADLDPHRLLAGALESRARKLGLAGFHFLTGDITASETRTALAAYGPIDVALFVGLSSWLPRTHALPHLRWLRRQLCPDGVL